MRGGSKSIQGHNSFEVNEMLSDHSQERTCPIMGSCLVTRSAFLSKERSVLFVQTTLCPQPASSFTLCWYCQVILKCLLAAKWSMSEEAASKQHLQLALLVLDGQKRPQRLSCDAQSQRVSVEPWSLLHLCKVWCEWC